MPRPSQGELRPRAIAWRGGGPTKRLTFYHIDTTRDADCFDDAARTKPGPCFPDYPQIEADSNGFYITTNVFDFNGPASTA